MMSIVKMLLAATLLVIIGNLVFCDERGIKCDSKMVHCPCGSSGKNVSVILEMCLVEHSKDGQKSCEPCNEAHLGKDPCEKFKECNTCSNGINYCLTCDPTNDSDICKKGVVYDFQPLEITYNADRRPSESEVNVGENHLEFPGHLSKRSTWCLRSVRPLPHTNIHCIDEKNGITCQLHCTWGSYFPGGREMARTIYCMDAEPIWKPQKFEDCLPHVNCLIVLVSDGYMNCSTSLQDEPDQCYISCADGKPHLHTCQIAGGYIPPLPNCVQLSNPIPHTAHNYNYHYGSDMGNSQNVVKRSAKDVSSEKVGVEYSTEEHGSTNRSDNTTKGGFEDKLKPMNEKIKDRVRRWAKN